MRSSRLVPSFVLVLAGCVGLEMPTRLMEAEDAAAAATDAGWPADAASAPDDAGAPEPPGDDAGEGPPPPGDAGADPSREGGSGPTGPRRFWWSTQVLDPSDTPRAIWGDGHVHSDFSGDGTRSARAMMDRAHALGADFVWITDHGRTPRHGGGITEREFDACSAAGRRASDADQFAGCGIEYRLGYTRADGSKVYEAWHQIVHGMLEGQFGEHFSANGYTRWRPYQDDLSGTSAYATLTHPSGPTPWYGDDDSRFRDTDPAHHRDVELIELNGGDDHAGNGNNRVDGINTYFRFLNDGWQVSPVWNSDMHHFYSGPEKAKGYGAWIDPADWRPGNYRAALRRSARRHNTFANHPGNQRNYIRVVSLRAAGGAQEAMMGSTLGPRARLHLRIRANISRGNERWTFRIYTNRNARFDDPLRTAGPAATEVVSSGSVQQWEPSIRTDRVRWVVVYASTERGAPGQETQYLVSAPIWINNR